MERKDQAKFASRREIVEAQQRASELVRPLIQQAIEDLGPTATEEQINEAVLRRIQLRPDVQEAVFLAEVMEDVAGVLKPIATPEYNDDDEVVWKKKEQPPEPPEAG